MPELITKNMGIMEAIQKYPDIVGVFVAHGLGCIGCAMANFETIEQGAMAHGMDLDALMKDLNEAAAEMGSKE
jgi:hybrid cluster-associated redox disulfide protein